jgi:hypothetical protein
LTVIKKIYSDLNLPISTEFENNVVNFLANDKKKRDDLLLLKKNKESEQKNSKKSKNEKIHLYEPSQFGLTYDELKSGKFFEYTEEFKIPPSKG